MGRLFKFVVGLAIGAGATLLVTPKTGREVRDMLAGPQVRGLMPTRVAELTRPRDEAPPFEPELEPVAETEPEVEEPVADAGPGLVADAGAGLFAAAPIVAPVVPFTAPVVAPPAEPEVKVAPADEAPGREVPVAEAPVYEAPVAEAAAEIEPAAEAPAESEVEPGEGDDLRARIEETRTDVVSEIQRPFQVVPDAPLRDATETEPVAEAEPAADVAPLLGVSVAETHDDAPELEAKLGETPGASSFDAEEPAAPADADATPAFTPAIAADTSDVPTGRAPEFAPAATVPGAPVAPSTDVWSADPVPPTFESELAEVPEGAAPEASTPAAPEPEVAEPAAEAPKPEPEVAEPVDSEIAAAPFAAAEPADAEPADADVAPPAAEAPVAAVADAPAEPVPAAADATLIADIPAPAAALAESLADEAPAPVEPAIAAVEPAAAEPEAAPLADKVATPPAPPADEAPQGVDQAEMRRRIEETRARLKAKAFDAMMSGEAALLARDSGERPVPRNADVPVDHEIAETIDESLSPDDY